MHKLILASQSPRRRELLTNAGFVFAAHSLEISEILNENLSLLEQIEDLALRKAVAFVDSPNCPKGQGILVLSADTVVVIDNQILGKPNDLHESEAHIRRLSGRTHQVITGVCIYDVDQARPVVSSDTALVTFKNLSDQDVHRYVESRDGMDKAGGYGIQGLGRALIEKWQGEFDTIMGLPVKLVERLIHDGDWKIQKQIQKNV